MTLADNDRETAALLGERFVETMLELGLDDREIFEALQAADLRRSALQLERKGYNRPAIA